MRDHKHDTGLMRTMDRLVITFVIGAVVLPFVMLSAPVDRRQAIDTAITVLAAVNCVLLPGWIWFADGANSKLWSWLPPFWPWGKYLTGTKSRWGLVVLLVFGTLCGIYGAR